MNLLRGTSFFLYVFNGVTGDVWGLGHPRKRTKGPSPQRSPDWPKMPLKKATVDQKKQIKTDGSDLLLLAQALAGQAASADIPWYL